MTMLGTRPPAPPPIDPRIRQRRIEVTRQSGRRRLRVLVGLVAFTVAIILGDFVLHSSWLSVTRVQVGGAHSTPTAAVDAAAAPVMHQPMISADMTGVIRRVDALPWVASATAARHWPHTLVVTVTERTPAAQAQAGDHWVVLDGTGRVLALAPAAAPNLPTLGLPAPPGPPGTTLPGPDLGAVQVAAAVAAAHLAPPVAAVAVDASGAVSLNLAGTGTSGGAVVLLGPPASIDAKLTALQTVLSGVDLSGAKTIDLTVPGRPVLTRR